MTALSSSQPDRRSRTDKPLDWSMLVSVDEAAPLMKKSARHLRRHLCPKLSEQGLAIHQPGPEGGQPRWWIDRRADLALAPGLAGEVHQEIDREDHTDRQNRYADLRLKCIMLLRHARQHWPSTQTMWMPKLLDQCDKLMGKRVTRSTLLRWDKNYKGKGSRVALIDKRGGDQKSSGDPKAWEHFKRLFLDDRAPSKVDCWRRTRIYADRQGIHWCRETSMRAQLDKRIPPEIQLFSRFPKLWKQQCEAGIDQDPKAWGAGEMWVGDHAQLDFFVRVPGVKEQRRPWITTWIDWRTRKIVGYHLGLLPNSTAILFAFRNAMLDEDNRGGPGHVSIDNGKDYDCWMFNGQTKKERQGTRADSEKLHQDPVAFAGIYGELDIKTHFSIPYGPNGKSRMERWFRTLHEQFDISWETYAGRDAKAKPEMLKRIKSNPALVPTMEEVKAELAKWVAAYNQRADHSIVDLVDEFGRKLAPNSAMIAWRDTTRIFNRRALDLFLMGWHKPVNVTRRGIAIAPYGQTLYYGRHDLSLMPYKTVPGRQKAAKVLVSYDPDDDRTIRVFTTRREFICETHLDEQGGGANHEQHRAAARKKQQYKKAMKVVNVYKDLIEDLSPSQVAMAQQPDDTPPPTQPTAVPGEYKIVRTIIDGQVDEIDREQMRMAAGAEHHTDDEDSGETPTSIYDAPGTPGPPEDSGDMETEFGGDGDGGDDDLPVGWSLTDSIEDDNYDDEEDEDDDDSAVVGLALTDQIDPDFVPGVSGVPGAADFAGDVPGGPDDDDTDVSFILGDAFDPGDDEPEDDGPSVLETLR